MNVSLFYIFLNVILISIEVAIIAYISGGFFLRRRSNAAFAVSCVIVLILFNVVVVLIEEYLLIKSIIMILISSFFIWYNYTASPVKSLFASALTISLIVTIDNAFLAIILRLFVRGMDLLNDPKGYYLLAYTAKLIELLLAVLVRTWSRRRLPERQSVWSNWLMVLLFPVTTLLTALILAGVAMKTPELSGAFFSCTLLLLITDLASILLLAYLERQQIAAMENTVLRQALKRESDHVFALRDAYSLQRKQTHDFNNQLSVLRSMAAGSASREEFEEYLGRILSVAFSAVTYVNTHRTVVDVLLSQKKTLAESKGIPFEMRLDNLSAFPLSDDALVVVLANLIDNAIEASEKIADPSLRYILLKMQAQPAAILYIENRTAGLVKIQSNRIKTTKEDSAAHGFGLANVCATIEQAGAVYTLNFQAQKNVFCFSARFPIQNTQ